MAITEPVSEKYSKGVLRENSANKNLYSDSLVSEISRVTGAMTSTTLHFAIRICLISALLINVVQPINWRKLWAKTKIKSTTCASPECKKYGNSLQATIKKDGTPCTDFYDYVCSKWETQYPRPKYYELWNFENSMEVEVKIRLKALLEDEKPSGDDRIEKAKELYRACISMPYMNKLPPNALKPIMTKAGYWPMLFPKNKKIPATVRADEIDSEYCKLAGESAFFDTFSVANSNNEPMIAIGRMFSPHGMLKRMIKWAGAGHREHYKAFLARVIKKIASVKQLNDAMNNDLEDVLKFRDELWNIIENVATHRGLTMSIAQLEHNYEIQSRGMENAKINWLDKIRSLDKSAKNATMVTIRPTYLGKLATLLGATPKRVILNHVHLYFAERHIVLDQQMESDLAESFLDTTVLTGKIRYEPERWFWCIYTHSMKVTLGRMYVNAYFSPETKNRVARLIDEMKELLEMQIKDSTWLDDGTKLKALGKVKNIKSSIGYPDGYFHENLNETEAVGSDLTPLIPDVYFLISIHTIHISASFLQWPMYSPKLPYAVEYGGMAATIGHELYHAFDQEGIKAGPDGKKMFRLPDMRRQYDDRVYCFRNAYNNFKDKENQKYRKSQVYDTTDEDMVDTMGLKLAYFAYKKKVYENNGTCPVLPGFEKFGCDKLFFITFANTLCTSATPGATLRYLSTSEHSLDSVRVNAAVAQLQEFSDAFDCKPDDPLNLRNRCDIWEKA